MTTTNPSRFHVELTAVMIDDKLYSGTTLQKGLRMLIETKSVPELKRDVKIAKKFHISPSRPLKELGRRGIYRKRDYQRK